MTEFVNELRKERQKRDDSGNLTIYWISEASVARHLRHLKAVARWANRQGLSPSVPTFDMPKRAKVNKMKGRPITGEEFDRMLASAAGIMGDAAAESWMLLLRGLWTSGLRLGEAMALRWDHQPEGVSVQLDGKHSVLAFDGEAQKSGRTQLVPLAPEAVQLLEPLRKSRGFVFTPLTKRGLPMARDAQKAGKIIGEIGEAAKVVTDAAAGRTATAHDLRRAFGARWSKRVMPAVLKEIMRHADIQTTMTYYVAQNARVTASELWAAANPATPRPETPRQEADAAAEH
jgi:integrase